jgi:hypothetical protein
MASVGDLYDLQIIKDEISFDDTLDQTNFNNFLNAAWYGKKSKWHLGGDVVYARDFLCGAMYQYYILMHEHPEWFDEKINVLIRFSTDDASDIVVNQICEFIGSVRPVPQELIEKHGPRIIHYHSHIPHDADVIDMALYIQPEGSKRVFKRAEYVSRIDMTMEYFSP